MYPTELKAGIQIDTCSVYKPIVLYTSVHSSIIHYNQKLKTIQVSVNK